MAADGIKVTKEPPDRVPGLRESENARAPMHEPARAVHLPGSCKGKASAGTMWTDAFLQYFHRIMRIYTFKTPHEGLVDFGEP